MYLIMMYTMYLRYLYKVETLKKNVLQRNESLIGQYGYWLVCIKRKCQIMRQNYKERVRLLCRLFLVSFAKCLATLVSCVHILFACPLAQDGASPADISLPHDRARPSTVTRYPGNCLHPSSALHSQESPFRCVYFIRLTGPVSVGRRHESYASPQHIVVSWNEKWSNFFHSRYIYIYLHLCDQKYKKYKKNDTALSDRIFFLQNSSMHFDRLHLTLITLTWRIG